MDEELDDSGYVSAEVCEQEQTPIRNESLVEEAQNTKGAVGRAVSSGSNVSTSALPDIAQQRSTVSQSSGDTSSGDDVVVDMQRKPRRFRAQRRIRYQPVARSRTSQQSISCPNIDHGAAYVDGGVNDDSVEDQDADELAHDFGSTRSDCARHAGAAGGKRRGVSSVGVYRPEAGALEASAMAGSGQPIYSDDELG